MPWELDIAALRRFERKILVPMPVKEIRKKILKLHAGTHHTLTEEDFEFVADQTEGYSGSDLSTLINDALMRPIKQLEQATHFKKVTKRSLIDDLKSSLQNSADDIDEEDEDLDGSIWMPIIIDNKNVDKAYRTDILKDPDVMEMDLAKISDKEVFVRKADLVKNNFTFFLISFIFVNRMILRKV